MSRAVVRVRSPAALERLLAGVTDPRERRWLRRLLSRGERAGGPVPGRQERRRAGGPGND
jgi:hypothetical protein